MQALLAFVERALNDVNPDLCDAKVLRAPLSAHPEDVLIAHLPVGQFKFYVGGVGGHSGVILVVIEALDLTIYSKDDLSLLSAEL